MQIDTKKFTSSTEIESRPSHNEKQISNTKRFLNVNSLLRGYISLLTPVVYTVEDRW